MRARANLKPVLITGLAQGGQLMTTTDVDNWPADATGVQGPELMERFLKHAERFGTEIIFDHVHTADLQAEAVRAGRRPGHLHLRRAHHRDRRLRHVPRPALGAGVHGPRRVGLRDLRRILLQGTGRRRRRRRQHGGRGSAVSSNIAKHVTVVHRRDKFRAEAILVDKLKEKVAAGKADDHVGSRARRSGRRPAGVTGMRVKNVKSNAATERKLHGVFIAIGHRPNTELFAGQLDMVNGYIVTKSGLEGGATATSIPGRVRGGRRAGSRLPPGGHQRGHRLHGRARRAEIPRKPRADLKISLAPDKSRHDREPNRNRPREPAPPASEAELFRATWAR